MKVSVPAKINLYLKVVALLPSGYHYIETIFHEISLRDELIIKKEASSGITLKVDSDFKKMKNLKKNNSIIKAYEYLSKHISKKLGVSVTLKKKIPLGAGLGGGSSDAAGLIRGMNALYNLGLSIKEEMNIASKVGADVPFFLNGGCALGIGRGDKIKNIDNKFKFWVVLVYPEVAVPTEFIYKEYDKSRSIPVIAKKHEYKGLTLSKNIINIKRYLINNNRHKLLSNLHNDLQDIALSKYPQVSTALLLLKENGGEIGGVSGSGSSVYALFSDKKKAEECFRRIIRKRRKNVWLLENGLNGIIIS
ncbi:MAG: 4-(cytidine 5'-diphospho)-2-C-methyl-D-erythritol kinase [bacterium]